MNGRKMLALVVCMFGASVVHATDTPLMQAVGPAVVLQNSTNGQSLGITGYYTGGPVYYSVAQWGIPSQLAAASGASSGWSVANPYARLQYYPSIDGGVNVYELAQAGSASLCNHERDLFLQTGDPGVSPPVSAGMTRSGALSTLGSVQLKVGLSIFWDAVSYDCTSQGYWDYGQYVYSIILQSTVAPIQTLFYQINLGKTTDPGHSSAVGWCPDYENGSNAHTDSYCLDDDVRNNAGGTWVSPGQNVVNNFDFLPRVLKIIKAGHTKSGDGSRVLDTDPGHWTMGAVYVGNIVQGNDVSTSRWYSLGLSTAPGGTFCNGTDTVQWSCFAGQPDGTGWVDVGGGCFHRDTGLACF